MSRENEERMGEKISQAKSAYGIDVSDRFSGQEANPKHRAKYDPKHVNVIARFPGCPPLGFLPETPL